MDGFYPSLSSPSAPPPPPPPPRRPAPLPPSPTKNFPNHSSSFSTDRMYRMYPPTPPPPPPPPPSAPTQPSQSFQVPYPPSSITMNVHYPPPPPPPPPPPQQFMTTVPPNSDPQFYPPGTVVIQVGSQAPVPWSTGLFDCSDDVGNCCMTCCCPCVTFGQIAEIVDRGSPSCGTSGGLYAMIMCLTGCHWMYSCFYRSKMRGQFLLEEGPIADCPVHCCCDCCALCQEYRELKYRGYDLFGGWEASMERKRKREMRPPAVQVSMRR